MLGEGAFWNHETGEFLWVDIEGMKVFIYNPETKKQEEIPVKQRVGTVVPAKNGNMIIALQNGVFELDLTTKQKILISNPEEHLTNIRFNDGKCDPAGRLWVGSMELSQKKNAASLYRIDITISNGICLTADHQKMYYTDSPTQKVIAFDYDVNTGNISNEKLVIKMPIELGTPDGMAIDEEGMLWIAHWGGYSVGRWNPETGELLARIEVPAPNVTSCAFVGENLDILYITTASVEMSPKQEQACPLAGGIFMAIPGVKGTKNFFFGK